MKRKNIWLVNFHAKPPEYEGYLKTIKFAQYLEALGYNATIFSSSNIHNSNIDISDNKKANYFEKEYNGIKFIHLKTIKYGKSSVLRILSMIHFSILLFLIRKKFQKPDTIVHTAYIPFDNLVYFTTKSLKAKYIVDILDLWPQSFVDLGLIKKNNPFLPLAYFAEKWLYSKAHKVIFCMKGGKDYIIERKWHTSKKHKIRLENILHIDNGVDLDDFNINAKINHLADEDLNNTSYKKIIYIGSIRHANNLKSLIDAASILKDEKSIKFLIYGNGNDREELIQFIKENNIDNVVFKDKWVDPKYVPYIISQSDVNILNYRNGFGLYGGSQSKLFQYLACGKPICSNIKVKYCIIEQNKLGVSENFNEPKEYADAILSLVSLSAYELSQIKYRSLEIVKNYDYKILTEKLVEAIESIKN